MKFKILNEQTLSGSGFPSATDSGGNQAIDKFPLGGKSKKKKNKKKTIIYRRLKPKII